MLDGEQGYGGGFGGGLFLKGGVAVLVNVTIAANQADGSHQIPNSRPAYGGGLCCTSSTVTVRNSIIANNGIGGDVWGSVTDAGYNLCSDGTADFSALGSLNQTNPLLGPLTANGGPTPTMVLLAGSPGRDAIPSGFPPFDQRHIARPQGPAADIGAVEGDSVDASPPQLTLGPPSANRLTLTLSAEPYRNYRLLSSSNLLDWLPLATNSLTLPGPLQFEVSVFSGDRLFFRIVTP